MKTLLDPEPRSALLDLASETMGRPRILLAEDDQELRLVLTEVLEEAGYEVDLAENGRELLRRLAESVVSGEGIDLVLSDVRMPAMNGLEALEALRDEDWVTPVLFMTAFGDAATHEEAKRLGAWMIDKPFDVDELVEIVTGIVPPARYGEGWR